MQKNVSPVPAKIREFVARCATRYPDIERVLLFGSRARGDARKRSDFDLAVVAPRMSHETWARFADEMRERIPTLCRLDLVHMDPENSLAIYRQIKKHGILLYDRAA